MNTKSIGDYGEKLARRYLRFHGYWVIDRNYNTRHGEIDIIAKKGKYLVFCEVKTRTDKHLDRYGRPATAVNAEKLNHIRYAINEYIRGKNIKRKLRIDIIEVYLSPTEKGKYRIEHIKGQGLQ